MRAKLVSMFAVAAVLAFTVALAKAPAPSAQEADAPDEADTTDTTAEAVGTTNPSFSVRCDFSHRNTDDPIVYPGVKGAAHSHDFFGNRSTKYSSTYESLRHRKAKTKCRHSADKSAYWVPTMKWNGKDLTPRYAIVYYRTGHKDPATVEPHPAGLKVVPNTNVTWRCAGGEHAQDPPTQCPNGQLDVRIVAPDCSNGELDSADHRSHMAYSVRPSDGGPRQCPDTHPTPVPALNMVFKYSIPTSEGKVTLSSGEASTMHADFFNAWHQETLEGLVARCINEVGPSDPQPEGCKLR